MQYYVSANTSRVMTEEDKPFLCPELGCGMSFTNEDHLSVHLRKHDMSLALNLSAASGVLSPFSLFTDQTPTPTKFLKNCEEIGLFQELSKSENPFDDSFKKANLLDPLDNTCDDAQTELFSGQLETPQPPQSGGLPEVVTQDTEVKSQSIREIDLSSIVPKKRKKFLRQSSSSIPTSTTSDDEEESLIGSSSLETQPLVTVSSDMRGTSQDNVGTVSSSTVEQSVTMATTTHEPVQATNTQATQAQQQNVMVMLVSLPNGQVVPIQVPTAQQVAKQQTPSGEQVVPVTSPPLQTNLPQVVPQQIVLPAGQPIVPALANRIPSVVQITPAKPAAESQLTNIPVHVRTVGLGTNSAPAQTGVQTIMAQPNTSVMTNSQPVVPIGLVNSAYSPDNAVTHSNAQIIRVSPNPKNSQKNSGSQQYTKQRLKAVLQNQQTPSSNQKISKIFQQVQEIKQEPGLSPSHSPSEAPSLYATMATNNHTSPRASLSSPNTISQGGYETDETESRRLKFLERNRAAAARCRQKRKHWVVNLEHKADELSKTNTRLSDEIKALRNEVCQLKTLLIAHKDCPVTQQQRSLGQITPQTFEIPIRKADSPPHLPSQTGNQSPVSQHSDETPQVISLIEHSPQNGSISADMVPKVVTMRLPTAVEETTNQQQHLGVITGPNSASIIPKIIKLEHLNVTSQKS